MTSSKKKEKVEEEEEAFVFCLFICSFTPILTKLKDSIYKWSLYTLTFSLVHLKTKKSHRQNINTYILYSYETLTKKCNAPPQKLNFFKTKKKKKNFFSQNPSKNLPRKISLSKDGPAEKIKLLKIKVFTKCVFLFLFLFLLCSVYK